MKYEVITDRFEVEKLAEDILYLTIKRFGELWLRNSYVISLSLG